MAEYNLPHEKGRNYFELYEGRRVEQMQRLMDDGRVPMSLAGLMRRKLDLRNDNPGVKAFYMDNRFDTGDLKGQRGDEIKLVLTTYADGSITPLGRKYLALINPQEKLINGLINGAVNLGIDDRYENLKGDGVIVTKRDKLAKVIDDGLAKQQAKDSLFWRFMLRHSDEVPKEFAIPGLHEEAIDYIFGEYQKQFAKNSAIDNLRLMAVYPGFCSEDVSEMRAWCVDWLGYWSSAYGRYYLDVVSGRFVGIAPEALSALGKSDLMA